jgi:hypothetical protein
LKRAADGRRVDGPDDLELDQPPGQQLHRPPHATSGSRRASDRHELRFLPAVELAVLPPGRAPAAQRRNQPVGDKLLAHATYGHERAAQRLADAPVAPGVGPVGVRLEQDLGATKHGGGMSAGADQTRERLALLSRQANDYLAR